MAYVKDEGTVLRRMMGAFSMRPTIVAVRPYNATIPQPGFAGNYSVGAMSLVRMTQIPIITVRIGNKNDGAADGTVSTTPSLGSSMNTEQWYLENKMIIPKSQSVVFSSDALFFYINRRFQSVNYGAINQPYQFTTLPVTFSGYETVNDTQVTVDQSIKIQGQDKAFEIKSVVCIETAKVGDNNQQLIIGNTAIFNVASDMQVCYDPHGSSRYVKSKDRESNPPVTRLPTSGELSFNTMASTRGTIFVYTQAK